MNNTDNKPKLDWTQLVFAAILAPLVPAIANLAISSNQNVILESSIYYIVGVLGTICIGIPGYLLLRKFDCYGWWQAIVAGMLVAGIPGLALAWLVSSSQDPMPIVLVTYGAGALTGAAFWLFAPKTNHPDPNTYR